MIDLKIPKRLTTFERAVSDCTDSLDMLNSELVPFCEDYDHSSVALVEAILAVRNATKKLVEAAENYDPRSDRERERDGIEDAKLQEWKDARPW
jgi:hypothetical protein